MLLKKGFRFRLDPTDSQRQLFSQFAGASRFLYNRGLEQRKKAYEHSGKSISYFDQNNELVSLKRKEATSWLKEIHSQVLQQALKNLDTGFQNFFQNLKNGRKPGFPRFKCKGVRDSFRYPQGVHIEEAQAYLPKIGLRPNYSFPSCMPAFDMPERILPINFPLRSSRATTLFVLKDWT